MEINKELSNSQIMKNISNIKKEIEETKQFLKNISNNNKVPVDEIQKTLDGIKSNNDELFDLNMLLLDRNYNNTIMHRENKYRPIELLKLKDKLFQEREINDIILKSDVGQNEDLLKISLETFQSHQDCKNEINEIFELLEEYNKKQGKI